MIIVICGSMTFSKEMLAAKEILEEHGHTVLMPEGVEGYAEESIVAHGGQEGADRKVEGDLIRAHYIKIQDGDAILVVNGIKRGCRNYIGGNTFLEMGFAHVLGKGIFVLHDLPQIELIQEELVAMDPFVLGGVLNVFKD